MTTVGVCVALMRSGVLRFWEMERIAGGPFFQAWDGETAHSYAFSSVQGRTSGLCEAQVAVVWESAPSLVSLWVPLISGTDPGKPSYREAKVREA